VWSDFVDDSPYLQRIMGVPKAKAHMVELGAQDGVSVEREACVWSGIMGYIEACLAGEGVVIA
jgi:hypothetical protein